MYSIEMRKKVYSIILKATYKGVMLSGTFIYFLFVYVHDNSESNVLGSMWELLFSFPGGGQVGLSIHKNFDIEYSIIHVVLTKHSIGQFIILTTRLTSLGYNYFNSGQQTVNIKSSELLYLWSSVSGFNTWHQRILYCIVYYFLSF